MTTKTPITLNFYDGNDEITKTHTKSVVPFGTLKRAIALESATENPADSIDNISGFICELFGDKFSPADLEKFADIEDVFNVFREVLARASDLVVSMGFQSPGKKAGN